MPDSQVRQRASGSWEVRWRTRDGRRRGRTFDTRSTAEAFLDGIRREQHLRRGGAVASITVETFAREKWLPGVEGRTARSTAATWESVTRNHIVPAIGSIRIAEVLVEDLDELYRTAAAGGASHGTLTKIRSVLSNIWAEARRLGYAADNPVALSRLPIRKTPQNDDVVLSLDEAMKVADKAADVWPGYRGPILVAAGAGLRWGEVTALTPADIDLEAGLIRVDKSLSEFVGSPRRDWEGVDEGALKDLADYGLLRSEWGSRDVNYRVTGDSIHFYRWLMEQEGSPIDQVEAQTLRLAAGSEFARRHPGAAAHFTEAFNLIRSDRTDDQNTSEIGGHLRSAIQDLVSDLAEGDDGKQEYPVPRLKSLIAGADVSERERGVLGSLVDLAEAVLWLDQRLAHIRDEADKDKPLRGWDETRRAVFVTVFVCAELDRAFGSAEPPPT